MKRKSFIINSAVVPVAAFFGIKLARAETAPLSISEIERKILEETNSHFDVVIYPLSPDLNVGLMSILPPSEVRRLPQDNLSHRVNARIKYDELPMMENFRFLVPEGYTHIYWRHKPEISLIDNWESDELYYRFFCRYTIGHP